jgi:hypothetical protein
MKNIDNYVSKFYTLLESKSGNVKPLIGEAYDANTKTYKTEAGLVMYGDRYNEGSATTTKKAYSISFPAGSSATFSQDASKTFKGVSLAGGTLTSQNQKTPNVSVSLNCSQNNFTYFDKGANKTVTLYSEGLPAFVTKMKNTFCVTKKPVQQTSQTVKLPSLTPEQICNLENDKVWSYTKTKDGKWYGSKDKTNWFELSLPKYKAAVDKLNVTDACKSVISKPAEEPVMKLAIKPATQIQTSTPSEIVR